MGTIKTAKGCDCSIKTRGLPTCKGCDKNILSRCYNMSSYGKDESYVS